MSVLIYGLNHQATPLDIRERLTFSQEALPSALKQAQEKLGVSQIVLLSTCNRVEICCVAEKSLSQDRHRDNFSRWLQAFHKLDHYCIDSTAYCYQDKEAIRHLIRVASGLDSMILGEPQIMGQVKTAFATALEAKTTGPVLNQLGQHSVAVAKHIRSTTQIGENPVTLAFATLKLVKRTFNDIGSCRVLFIGAGEITELMARYFVTAKIQEILIANRNLPRAEELAHNLQGQAVPLDQLDQHLASADIVIASTGSPTPLLSLAMVKAALKKRQDKPVLMVDLAVPRDIEPKVGQLDNIQLYSIDDLKNIVEANYRGRMDAALLAEDMAHNEAIRFMDYLKGREAIGVIGKLRQHAEAAAAIELNKAQSRLNKGADPKQVIADLANALTNKWLHHPTVMLRQASESNHSELLDKAYYLHQLHIPLTHKEEDQ